MPTVRSKKGALQEPDGSVSIERRFRLKPRKTAKSSGIEVDMVILPPLADAIDSLPKTQLTFLIGAKGKPYSEKILGYKMREWCDAAGLKHCSAHGLRKAFATITSEGSATTPQLMAAMGWTNSRQADVYTRAADRRKLADQGAKYLKLE
jgi:integrase